MSNLEYFAYFPSDDVRFVRDVALSLIESPRPSRSALRDESFLFADSALSDQDSYDHAKSHIEMLRATKIVVILRGQTKGVLEIRK